MQKVYLLLRNNKQSGPYSLEEILQLNLKPFDLVWMHGRSAAWQYPGEIETLKPYVSETPQAEMPFKPIATAAMEQEKFPQTEKTVAKKNELPRNVFVSIPKSYQPLQHETPVPKIEPVNEPVSPYAGIAYPEEKPRQAEPVTTNYSRSINTVEEDYTNWMYQKKTKKKFSVNSKDFVIAALILGIIAGGYYVMSRPSVTQTLLPANKLNTPAVATVPEINSQSENKPQQESGSPAPIEKTSLPKDSKMKNPASVPKQETRSVPPANPVQHPTSNEKPKPNIPSNDEVITSREPEPAQPGNKIPAPAEKKKKLGDVIKNIFTKKDKKETAKNTEVVTEEPRPAENRQATRREENTENRKAPEKNSAETNTAALTSMIDLSSNAPDNWMMGIKNLKITLRNRSEATLQTASVQVNYYDENNQLLDKKMIYFSNVAPKAKATVSAPDHKFADHVEYKLVTVSAKEDRYAQN
jgi:hypothetical protein